MKHILMPIALVVGCFITSYEPASAKERSSNHSETVKSSSQELEQKGDQTTAVGAGPYGQFTTQVVPLIGEQEKSKKKSKELEEEGYRSVGTEYYF